MGKKQKTPDELNVQAKDIHFTFSNPVDIIRFIEWCKANKKEFVVKIFERYEKLMALEEKEKMKIEKITSYWRNLLRRL